MGTTWLQEVASGGILLMWGQKDGRESGGLYGGVYNCLLFLKCAAVFHRVYAVVYGPHDCKRLLLLEELAGLSSW